MANLIEIIIRASGSSQVRGEVTAADKALGGLTKTLGAFGVALGARELIAFTGETMEMARAQKDARNALTSTLGSAASYSQAIDQARVVTRNMMSETALASNINSVLAMGLADTATEAAGLAQAGTVLGNVFKNSGGSVEKYFMLLSGGSNLLLNNFGLTLEQVNAKKAEIEATRGLTGEEAKLQAIKELTLESAQRYNDALSDETVAANQTQAAAEDLKAAWGELTNTLIYSTGAAGKAAEAMRGLKAIVEGDSSAQQKHAQDILLASESYAQYNRAMNMSGLQSQRLSKTQFEHVKAALAASDATADLGSEALRLTAAANREAGAIQAANTATSEVSGWAAVAAKAQKDLGDEYLTSADSLEQYVNALARAQMYGSFAPSMNLATDWQSFQDQMAMDAAHRRQLEKQEEERKNEEVASQWVRSQEQASNRIKSVIENVLGQTTLSAVWQPPEADTGRIDENARRLATVATSGFGSEWLQQLSQQYQGMDFWQPIADAMQAGDEGALKEAATQLLTGPDVSKLWDIELIKQKVRDQLQADNVRQQLVETIQQELAGEGTAATTVQVGAAMGVEQEAPTGMDMSPVASQIAGGLSGALPDAMVESGASTAMLKSITEAVKADEKNMKLLATAFAEGFSTYLPAAMGMPADVFLASLVNEVAGRLGIATELRP